MVEAQALTSTPRSVKESRARDTACPSNANSAACAVGSCIQTRVAFMTYPSSARSASPSDRASGVDAASPRNVAATPRARGARAVKPMTGSSARSGSPCRTRSCAVCTANRWNSSSPTARMAS